MLLKWKIFNGQINKRNKLSKCNGKYVNVLEFLIYLDFLLITSESVTIASFMSAVGAQLGFTTLLITIFFPWGNKFVILLPSSNIKNWNAS